MDTNVEKILSSVPCVALYEMTDKQHRQWSRTEVEGALFVVKRKTQPRFHFIILNRCSNAQNLVHDLLSGFEYEIQVQYLVYGNGAHTQKVNAIWFENPNDYEEIVKVFNRIRIAVAGVLPGPSPLPVPRSKNKQEEKEKP